MLFFTAIKLDEVPVASFTYRPLVDGFDYDDQFTKTSGLFKVDFQDQFLRRTARASAHYYARVITQRGVLRQQDETGGEEGGEGGVRTTPSHGGGGGEGGNGAMTHTPAVSQAPCPTLKPQASSSGGARRVMRVMGVPGGWGVLLMMMVACLSLLLV
jgi:hypothetical protein